MKTGPESTPIGWVTLICLVLIMTSDNEYVVWGAVWTMVAMALMVGLTRGNSRIPRDLP